MARNRNYVHSRPSSRPRQNFSVLGDTFNGPIKLLEEVLVHLGLALLESITRQSYKDL